MGKGGRIVGDGPDGGHGHVQAEVLEPYLDAFAGEGVEQVEQHRVVDAHGIDGGEFRPGAVDDGADVAFDEFARALEHGFLETVAGGGAVELVEDLEPVQGHGHVDAPGHVPGRDEAPGHEVEDAPGVLVAYVLADRGPDEAQRGQGVAEAGFGLGPGGRNEVFGVAPEGKKAEAFGQFH